MRDNSVYTGSVPSNYTGTTNRLSNYTVQLQARGVHCPIKAQFGMVIINHVRELSCSFDDFQPRTLVSKIRHYLRLRY